MADFKLFIAANSALGHVLKQATTMVSEFQQSSPNYKRKILSFTLVLNVSRGDLAGDGEKMLGEMAPKVGDEMSFKFAEDVLLSSLLSGRRRLVRYEDRRDTLTGGGGVEKSSGGVAKSGPPETGARLFRFTSKVMLEDFFMSWNVNSI